jgi:rhodanese-related sulfurtransferase
LPWRRSPAAAEPASTRRWVKVVLVVFVLPTLIGGVVLLVAGRPIAFQALQWRIARRFPEVRWIKPDELDRWRTDSARPQPVVLDARTDTEYQVSRLKNAVRIDPYRPSLRALSGVRQDSAIVVCSSAGYRGARVAEWLRRMGYRRVENLDGGIFAWVNEGRPIFRGDTPTAQVHPYDRNWGRLVDSRYRAEAADLEKSSAAP